MGPRRKGLFPSLEARKRGTMPSPCEGARKRGMPVASPAGDCERKSLLRARRRGTALAVDEVLERKFYSECNLKIMKKRKAYVQSYCDFQGPVYEIRLFLFAYTSHMTAANPSPARLIARCHLIRRPAAATFPSREGSHKSDGRKFKFLCTKFAAFLFAYTSHMTAANPSPATLSAR